MQTKERRHQIRVYLVLILCTAGLVGLGVRLFHLQIRDAELLRQRGERQQSGRIPLKPERGTIFDRNQVALAQNTGRPCLRLLEEEWQDSNLNLERLAQALDMEPELVKSRVDMVCQRIRNSQGRLRSDVLFFNINETQKAAIEQLNLSGLFFSDGTGRVYPGGSLAGSTLGFVGLEGGGLEGLERYADSYLQGSLSSVLTLRDGHGINLFWTDLTEQESTRGADVILALDQYIQFLAEQEVEQIGREFTPLWASIVVMEPYRGEVLAIANYPSYDPNRVETSAAVERKNYAICEAFEPGSTVKAFSLAGAIESQVVTPETPIYCEKGRYRIHRHTLRDDIHAFEWLSVAEVLAHSSNIGVVKIAEMMGQERLYSTLRGFGFGRMTGVTFPGESPGLLRPVNRWSGLSIAAIPFGQEMQTTVLALTNAYCALANGGWMHTPKLILGYRSPRTGEFRPHEYPEPYRVVSAETALTMTQMLTGVTEQGTNRKMRVPGFRIAGKTGTAQVYDPAITAYSRSKYVSSFVGYLPAEQPRVVIAVVVNQPKGAKYGNEVSGPAFSRLASNLMQYLGVFPTDPETQWKVARGLFPENTAVADLSLPVPSTARAEAHASLVVGMTMREAYEQLSRQGIPHRFLGSGVALVQEPRHPILTQEQSESLRVRFFPPERIRLN